MSSLSDQGMSYLSPQALLPVPVLEEIVRSSTRMARVCAELVSFSIMNWISKALQLTVCWTANLRSVEALPSCEMFIIIKLYKFHQQSWRLDFSPT